MNNILYKAHVIPGIGASEPGPITDKNLLIRYPYAYI